MNEEKNNIDQINNDIQTTPEIPNTPPAVVPAKSEEVPDLSKVKISAILKERTKKCGVKKIIAFILVAIISFAAGVGVDRAFMNHRNDKGFKNRPGMNRQIPKDRFNNNQPNKSNPQKP